MPSSKLCRVVLVLVATAAPGPAHPGGHHDDDPPPAVVAGESVGWLLVASVVVAAAGVAALAGRSRYLPSAGLVAILSGGLAVGCGVAEAGPPQPRHDPEAMRKPFEAFRADGVSVRAEGDFLLVDSTAFPRHPMMVGITAWQQQVPLPQPYTGRNAWRLPLAPALAAKPVSARTGLFRGAIALAANGVPIFNALNNRGEDAFLAGELDEFGGHCGRGDDYHYHAAPVHLQAAVGTGQPIGYALDGFPLMGLTDTAGKEPADLDEFNGRLEADGRYRYYSTRTYPYVNGGMRGVVSVRGGQVDPQLKDSPARPAGEPLRGAKVVGFDRDDAAKTYAVRYELRGKPGAVRYTLAGESVRFTYQTTDGREQAETYRRR